ncbi:MAG: polysaccharide deacetylase family protein [Myxococcales bacterium]|nr:polysaccharide deacetylase family protein [Myxococcales bacterium]
MSRRLLLICACLCLALLPVKAIAGKWPRPAGGPSKSGDPELLLTFDDGPHEKHTTKILDALDEHGLQAIFFWTGHRVVDQRKGLEDRIALVERTVRTGHLIGNHTTTHAKLCVVKEKDAARELDENAERYEKLAGLPQFLMRVPYGARCKRLDNMLAEREIEHMHWDLDPQEFRHHSSDITFSYVTKRLKRLKPGMRAILLMHDTQPAAAKALPKILKWIDKENEKRAERGKRPIRIISGSEYVEEKYPVPLLNWTRTSLVSSQDAVVDAARRLVP